MLIKMIGLIIIIAVNLKKCSASIDGLSYMDDPRQIGIGARKEELEECKLGLYWYPRPAISPNCRPAPMLCDPCEPGCECPVITPEPPPPPPPLPPAPPKCCCCCYCCCCCFCCQNGSKCDRNCCGDCKCNGNCDGGCNCNGNCGGECKCDEICDKNGECCCCPCCCCQEPATTTTTTTTTTSTTPENCCCCCPCCIGGCGCNPGCTCTCQYCQNDYGGCSCQCCLGGGCWQDCNCNCDCCQMSSCCCNSFSCNCPCCLGGCSCGPRCGCCCSCCKKNVNNSSKTTETTTIPDSKPFVAIVSSTATNQQVTKQTTIEATETTETTNNNEQTLQYTEFNATHNKEQETINTTNPTPTNNTEQIIQRKIIRKREINYQRRNCNLFKKQLYEPGEYRNKESLNNQQIIPNFQQTLAQVRTPNIQMMPIQNQEIVPNQPQFMTNPVQFMYPGMAYPYMNTFSMNGFQYPIDMMAQGQGGIPQNDMKLMRQTDISNEFINIFKDIQNENGNNSSN